MLSYWELHLGHKVVHALYDWLYKQLLCVVKRTFPLIEFTQRGRERGQASHSHSHAALSRSRREEIVSTPPLACNCNIYRSQMKSIYIYILVNNADVILLIYILNIQQQLEDNIYNSMQGWGRNERTFFSAPLALLNNIYHVKARACFYLLFLACLVNTFFFI